MRDAFGKKSKKNVTSKAPAGITLRKPTAISGKAAWFERFYNPDTQLERDRLLFSTWASPLPLNVARWQPPPPEAWSFIFSWLEPRSLIRSS